MFVSTPNLVTVRTSPLLWWNWKNLSGFVLHLLHDISFLSAGRSSAHGDGHVNPQVAVVGEQMCDGGVEHQAVAVHDGRRHAVVDGARRGLPREPPAVPVQLQSVGEVLALLARADEQHHGEELLVALVLLLLFQDQHEVVVEAGLHHHPVHSARQVDVRRQEDDVLPLVESRSTAGDRR